MLIKCEFIWFWFYIKNHETLAAYDVYVSMRSSCGKSWTIPPFEEANSKRYQTNYYCIGKIILAIKMCLDPADTFYGQPSVNVVSSK